MAVPKTPTYDSTGLNRVCRAVAVFAFACVLTSNLHAAVIESVNASSPPNRSGGWAAADVGWMYTPSLSYELTGVETKFLTADNRTVDIEIYSDAPSNGGMLLRSSAFTPVAAAFSGASFPAFPVAAGRPFFIGFRNVAGLGANTTTAAEGPQSLGPDYYDFDGLGSYANHVPFTTGDVDRVILRLNGTAVPEPATLPIAALALTAFSALRARRYRSASDRVTPD